CDAPLSNPEDRKTGRKTRNEADGYPIQSSTAFDIDTPPTAPASRNTSWKSSITPTYTVLVGSASGMESVPAPVSAIGTESSGSVSSVPPRSGVAVLVAPISSAPGALDDPSVVSSATVLPSVAEPLPASFGAMPPVPGVALP